MPRLGKDRTQAEAWEDIHVIALAWFVTLALELCGLVWAARGENDGAVRPGICQRP
jgi:hypothetical protein